MEDTAKNFKITLKTFKYFCKGNETLLYSHEVDKSTKARRDYHAQLVVSLLNVLKLESDNRLPVTGAVIRWQSLRLWE